MSPKSYLLLSVDNAQNMPSAISHDYHGRCDRSENDASDVINFSHSKLDLHDLPARVGCSERSEIRRNRS